MTKYTNVCIYIKKTNLLDYFADKEADTYSMNRLTYDQRREYYAREREVQLIALFRYDGAKCFCKIKCPINPLPTKGEFECVSMAVVDRFLKRNGWGFKQKLYPRMFE